MSRAAVVVCRGAPRDLGLDQGRAARARVREAARAGDAGSRWRRHAYRDPLARRVERDTGRFFPHMAERSTGLGRGAGVAAPALARLLAADVAAGSAGATLAAAVEGSAGPLIGCAWRNGPGDWLVRRSEPENDHRSVEVVEPWSVPARAGVNEHGLAVAASTVGAGSTETCAAPASLLAQDCLQRFDTVEKAIEWCTRRPAGGRFAMLLADAGGDVAGVLVDGSERRVSRPADGVLCGRASDPERAALEKACAARRDLDAAAFLAALEAAAGSAGLRLILDPRRCRLGVLSTGRAAAEWIGAPG